MFPLFYVIENKLPGFVLQPRRAHHSRGLRFSSMFRGCCCVYSFANYNFAPVCFWRVLPGDAVVAFSRKDIFSIKREIESKTNHRCCVIYGSLPQETRAHQVKQCCLYSCFERTLPSSPPPIPTPGTEPSPPLFLPQQVGYLHGKSTLYNVARRSLFSAAFLESSIF